MTFGYSIEKYLFAAWLLMVSTILYSQDATLSGIISDNNGMPVQAATVAISGTTLGSATDQNGYYHISRIRPGYYKVRISLIGYETTEVQINISEAENHADVTLKESNINLNEVVITGTRSEKTLKNVPVITQVISARQMLNLGLTNVTGALQNMVPGLDFSQYGTRTSITMQGMSSKYVLFLIDGERIAGEVNGDIDYSILNLENIDRIEVIKGASSSLYGSNAIGGVINILTNPINEDFDGKFYSRYTKNNEIYSGGGVSFKKGPVGSSTSFNFSHTDGYDNTPDTPHDWTQNPYSTFTLNQKFEIKPGPGFMLVPYLNYYQFERGNVSARPAHDLYRDISAGFRGKIFAGVHSLNFSLYRDRYNTYDVLELLNDRKDLVSYNIINTVRTQGNFMLSERNSLVAGLEYNYENLYSERIEGGIRNAGEAVAYLQEDVQMGALNVVAGIRGSYHSNYGFNAAPKLSLLIRYGSLNFRASAGTGFRSPSLKELYMNFDHFGEWYIIGNTGLKPESSRYISGSAELLKPWNNSSVTVYRNGLTNMITDRWLNDSAQLTRQYQNIASASVFGIDVLSRQKLFGGLWMSAGYSYVHSYDDQTGLQLYGTTKHSGNISLDYNYRKRYYALTARIYCKLMGEKFYEIADEGTFIDKPYSSVRITISQEYKWIRISTGVDNVFNLVLPGNINFISPGRRFFIGINLDFNGPGKTGKGYKY